jgi:HK97 family phage portal protein
LKKHGFIDKWLSRSLDGYLNSIVQKYFGAGETKTGIVVDENEALKYSSYFAANRVLYETLATMPVILYKDTGDNRDRATKHPLYKLIHMKPNSYMTAYEWKELMSYYYLHYGRAYAEKKFGSDGYVKELIPLDPTKMTTKIVNGSKVFLYREDGQKEKPYLQWEIFHVHGFSTDGIDGKPTIELHENAIGLGMAIEEYGSKFFANDASPGGFLKHPGKLSDDAYKRLLVWWDKRHKGVSNKHKLGILEEGMEFNKISADPEESQMMDSRKFQRGEMASVNRIPPHLVGDLEHATFTNIEHQSIEFVKYTMLPHFTRWEQAFTTQLLPEKEQGKFYFEFLVDALMRGDMQSRFSAYQIAINNGFMSINDVCKRENMNKIDGGDKHYIPLNLADINEPKPVVEENKIAEGSDPEDAEEEQPVGIKEKAKRTFPEYETRTKKDIGYRKTLKKTYRKLFRDSIGAIQHREIDGIKKGIDKYLTVRSSEEFTVYIDELYKELAPYIEKKAGLVVDALGGNVVDSVASAYDLDPIDEEDIRVFTREYIEYFVKRYTAASKSDIKKALIDAIDNQIDFEKKFADMFVEWEENRADRNAEDEASRGVSAFTFQMFTLSEIRYGRWVTSGADTCDACRELDGTVVELGNSFVNPQLGLKYNGKFYADGRSFKHPPAHGGCNCEIVPA